MGYCRTEPGGAPGKLFAGQSRYSAEKSSHMVLAIPFRQLIHVFLDRVEDGNGIRLDVLLDVQSWRLLLANSQFLGAAYDGVESLGCKNLPVLLLRVLLLQSHFFLLQLLLLGNLLYFGILLRLGIFRFLFFQFLYWFDADELGLSVQNISPEEIRLLQKALYLVDCQLTTCHHR